MQCTYTPILASCRGYFKKPIVAFPASPTSSSPVVRIATLRCVIGVERWPSGFTFCFRITDRCALPPVPASGEGRSDQRVHISIRNTWPNKSAREMYGYATALFRGRLFPPSQSCKRMKLNSATAFCWSEVPEARTESIISEEVPTWKKKAKNVRNAQSTVARPART